MFCFHYKGFTQKWHYFLPVLFLLPALLQAQQYNFRSWTLEHGLPQSQVTDIMQDSKGQLWLATLGGVSLFNGANFTNFTKQKGLPSNNIQSLFQDSRGRIWVGTLTSGLSVYDGVSGFGAYPDLPALQTGGVHDIAEDKLGRVWLATDSGLFYLHNNIFSRSKRVPVQLYTALLCTPSGEIWAGSATQGLYLLYRNAVTHYTQTDSLPGNHITCLHSDKTGTIWIGTDKGIAFRKQGKLKILALPAYISSPEVSGFAHDRDNNTWISLRNSGLLKYNGNDFTHITKKNGLKTNKVAALATDSEGNVWVGTSGYGLQQYKSPWFVHYFDFEQVKEPKITALAKDSKGTLWMGSDDGHVARQENDKFSWLGKTNWPTGTTIHHILVNPRQEAWLCTSNGIWKLKNGQYTRYGSKEGLPADEVYDGVQDEDGTLWFATAGGVAQLQNGRFTTIPSPATGKAYVLWLDQEKQLWLGGENGIFTIRNNRVEEVPALSRLNPREVTTIAEDSLGNLYFGGFNFGLLTLDKPRQIARHYTAQQGLPYESLVSLYVDYSDNLWVGTSRNVLKIPLEPLRQRQQLIPRTYTYHDGFRGIEVGRNTIIQSADSAIWFGTAKGLTRYHHTLDRRNDVYPTALLTDIQLFMQPTDWNSLGFETDSISGLPVSPQFSYNQNHITFNFHGICMTWPEKVRYKYKLQGLTDEWSDETKHPFITFANLDPGSYTFELLAQNNDGYWTPSPLSYNFSIMPPVWQRAWFIGLALALVVASVVSVVRWREQSLVKLNLLLEQKVRHRTRLLEEKNKEKETLLKEIHHRVKNNLQIVISLLNIQARQTNSPEAIDVMRAVRNRVRSMAILHERLYQHHDLGQIDLNHYFTQICESLYSSFGVTKERIALQVAVPHIKVDIDSAITLGLIVNEIISNAIKYAFPENKHGILSITLDCPGNNTYTLIIADNGTGLPQDLEQRQVSFGLQLVNSLIQKLHGKVEFKNNNGTMAVFTFVIPS